jgi:hypothetical protein
MLVYYIPRAVIDDYRVSINIVVMLIVDPTDCEITYACNMYIIKATKATLNEHIVESIDMSLLTLLV